MTTIIINGESRSLANNATIAQLLEALNLRGQKIAVEVNGAIIPKSQHEKTALAEGDKLEIISAVGGG